MKDLNQNNLKTYTGPEIMEGTYDSKATLTGYEITQISTGAFSTDFIAKTPTMTDKAAATKAYKEAVAQLKSCLKGFTVTDTSNENTQETTFATDKESDAVVLVSLQDINDEYNVMINIKKRKENKD